MFSRIPFPPEIRELTQTHNAFFILTNHVYFISLPYQWVKNYLIQEFLYCFVHKIKPEVLDTAWKILMLSGLLEQYLQRLSHHISATALQFFAPPRGRSFQDRNPAPSKQVSICGLQSKVKALGTWMMCPGWVEMGQMYTQVKWGKVVEDGLATVEGIPSSCLPGNNCCFPTPRVHACLLPTRGYVPSVLSPAILQGWGRPPMSPLSQRLSGVQWPLSRQLQPLC